MKKNVFVVAAALCAAAFFAQSKTAMQLCEEARKKQAFADWYAAIELYQEASQKNPAYAQAWAGLAECSYSLGEYSLAASYCDKALKYLPGNVEMRNLKGFAKIGMGELDEARKIFSEVLAKFPNDVDSRFGLAELDIYDGKITSAEQTFKNALRRQPENKRALLSLAVISHENGKEAQASQYLKDALFYHGNSADTHYFAGFLAAKKANFAEAEEYARDAIRLAPNYDKAHELLAFALLKMSRHEELIGICDNRLLSNPRLSRAWFVRGAAFARLGNADEAARSFEECLKIDPFDEIARSALEDLALENLSDDSRLCAYLADFHEKAADDNAKKYLYSAAAAEYLRALAFAPDDFKIRQKYAELLLQEGQSEKYLSQLKILAGMGDGNKTVQDRLASFSKKNAASLYSKWNVNSDGLDKKRYKIGIFYEENVTQTSHPDAERIAAKALASLMNANSPIAAEFFEGDGSKFAKAFGSARQNKLDYFLTLKVEESANSVAISADLFISRTGAKALSFSIYRSGNSKYSAALQKLSEQICQSLSLYGNVLRRDGSRTLIDIGKLDGVKEGQSFKIIRNGGIKFADFSTEISADDGDVLGTLSLTSVGDEVSEGVISLKGFSDFVSQGNLILPIEEMPLIAVLRESGEGGEEPSVAKELKMPVRQGKSHSLVELLRSIERSVFQ